MIHVIAGSFVEARDWMIANGLDRKAACFVKDPFSLMGLERRTTKVVFTGKWKENPDIERIKRILYVRNFIDVSGDYKEPEKPMATAPIDES